jgi:hypothetical protein
MTKQVMRAPTPPSPPLVIPGEIALSDSKKPEALANSLEAQFQPVTVTVLSVPAVIEMVQRSPLHPPFFLSIEARSSDLHPETREGSSTALILSAH